MVDDQRRAEARTTPAVAGARHEDIPADGTAPTAAAEEVDNLFPIATEISYHTAREAWFAGLQRLTLFINVALGAGLLAAYIDARLAGFLVALASALDVTLDFAGQARRHRELRSRYAALAEEAEDQTSDPAAVRRSCRRLDADAPPSFRAVEAIAFNQAVKGLGRDPDYRFHVPLGHRLMRHLWRFGGADYETLTDRRERLSAEEGSKQ